MVALQTLIGAVLSCADRMGYETRSVTILSTIFQQDLSLERIMLLMDMYVAV